MSDTLIGEITHFFNKINVAVLSLTDTIELGDVIHILGHTTDFQQTVRSMQVDHKPVKQGNAGDEVALRVDRRVRVGDEVYKPTVDRS